MEHPQIYCVALNGPGLNDATRDALAIQALLMVQMNKDRTRINSDLMEGEIRTDRSSGSLGSVSGMRFHALVETDRGKTRIEYLIRAADIDEAMNLFGDGKPWIQICPFCSGPCFSGPLN